MSLSANATKFDGMDMMKGNDYDSNSITNLFIISITVSFLILIIYLGKAIKKD